MPFQPTDELPIRLTVLEWNQIITALGEEKQRIANPLINKINQQAAQLEQQSQQPGFTNGEMKSDVGEPVIVPRGDLN